MADLKINNVYLIQQGFYEIFNKEYYESLIPMVHTHTTLRMDDGERFYFHCPIEDIHTSVDEWSIHNEVFKDEVDFLKFSVRESSRLGIKIDKHFKKLILKSRENHPEKWI
jgi:hypothetical protein